MVLLLAASYFAPYVKPSFFWWPTLLGLAYPYLLFLNVVFVFIWTLFYWRYLFLSLICIGAGVKVHNHFFQFSGIETNSKEGIKVLSFNVKHFYSYLEDKNKDDNVLDFIARQNANIICLQETKLQKKGALNPLKLKAHFPGIVHCQLAHQGAWSGPVTFTSYPIVAMGEIRFENSNNMVIYTDVRTEEDTIRVYNCHLQSYGIQPEEYSVIDTLGFQNKKLHEMRLIGGKLRNAFKIRSEQVAQLKEHIGACPYPVIVCGDFNDIPISYTYHTLRTNLHDAFVESGKGISNTYRGKLPSYRIDYILYSDEFMAYNYKRMKVDYSDHFPISTLLVRSKLSPLETQP